jgi:hypothetical protein
MFLSRSGSFSQKDRDDLAKACAAEVKKSCSTVSSSTSARELAKCLADHSKGLSAQCRDGIKKMRHDKDGDDACAGACICPQTCVGHDDDDHDKDKGKGKGNSGGGKGSLRVATAATTSHDASHDKDHDDDDLECVGACPAGMTACDGRCVDLRSDPDNCGRCDNECQENHGQVCSNGKCAAKCASTLSNCTGACVDEQTDPANCGACGLACGCDQTCSGGVCGSACPGQNGACQNDLDCCDPRFPNCTPGGCSNGGVGLKFWSPAQ